MKMSKEELLKNCHFIPSTTMIKVIEYLETSQPFDPIKVWCKRNLVKLQESRTRPQYGDSELKSFKSIFRVSCCKAIYSHNWNKLLYLLKKCPPSVHTWKDTHESSLYVRALIILLMYHPTSQTFGLLNEYLHYVWSCRTDEDKKAVLKILLTLPNKIHGASYEKHFDKA